MTLTVTILFVAIMRGPMVNQVLNQLITLTKWGDLDYLVIDMPPGTGDVQLTLAQALNISAAVIVTTPQRLSFVDVVKGIDMFDTVNVPSIAVVENMASYMSYDFSEDFFHHLAKKIVENGDQSVKKLSAQLQESVQKQKLQRRIFGEGHNPKLKTMWGMENIISVPLVEDISQCGDKGTPFVLQFPQSEVAKTYQTLANIITSEITRLSAPTKDQITAVNFDDNSKTIKLNGGAAGEVNSKDLRCNCRCAVCVEELTGKKLLKDETISPSVRPLGMAPIGRYAWSVDWSDGHKSLYPFKQLSALAKAPSVAS